MKRLFGLYPLPFGARPGPAGPRSALARSKTRLLACVFLGMASFALSYTARDIPLHVSETYAAKDPLDPVLFASMFVVGVGYGALPVSLLYAYNNWPRGKDLDREG